MSNYHLRKKQKGKAHIYKHFSIWICVYGETRGCGATPYEAEQDRLHKIELFENLKNRKYFVVSRLGKYLHA